jgi:predicted HNH restriction endonuclease
VECEVQVCKARGFDFDAVYGPEHAGSYIEIHHVEPLADYEGEVDSATGLVPLCANCHRMVHRGTESVMAVEELRNLLKARGFVER